VLWGNSSGIGFMDFFQKRKQILICAAAVVIAIGFVGLRYLPLQKKLKAAKRSLNTQKLVIDKGLLHREQIETLKEQLVELQSKLENYQENIPDQRDLGGFLHRIAGLMDKHNLNDQQVEPEEQIETDTLTCIPIEMRCKGSLSQIFEFFKSLQELDRSVRIEQVKLSNDRDFSGRVSLYTKAIIYYRAQG